MKTFNYNKTLTLKVSAKNRKEADRIVKALEEDNLLESIEYSIETSIGAGLEYEENGWYYDIDSEDFLVEVEDTPWEKV